MEYRKLSRSVGCPYLPLMEYRKLSRSVGCPYLRLIARWPTGRRNLVVAQELPEWAAVAHR